MSDWLSEYKSKLKEAENTLHECENILRENGVVGPIDHPKVAQKERIWFPSGYIRKADHFREDYGLRKLIIDLKTRNNIAYALQLSDLLNYIINRFYLGDYSVGNTFYRMATAHIFTIIESILCGAVNHLHGHCVKGENVCKRAGKCDLYFKRAGSYSFSKLLEKLQNEKIIQLTTDDTEKLETLKEIRDRFHMWDTGDSDFHDAKFKISDYNDAIQLLTRIRDIAVKTFPNYQAKQVFSCPKANFQQA